jgi:murein DD-endopeptidase MepM/ murein hydrolase activator NlpD
LSALRSLLRPTGRHRKRRTTRLAPAIPAVSVAVAIALGVPLVGATAGAPGDDRPAALPLAVAAPIAVAAPTTSAPAAARAVPAAPAPRRAPAAARATTRRAAPARGYDQAAENQAFRAAAAEPAPRRATPARADRSRRQPTAGRTTTPEAGSVEVRSGQWARPARGVFTSGFKWRWGRQHKGIDIAAPIGTPIYAATDGVVVTAGWNGGYGKFVLIQHSGGVATAYGHNTALLVRPGQRVTAGQQITRMGSTGHSTGSHLHFEVRINGVQTDPIPYLARRGVRI